MPTILIGSRPDRNDPRVTVHVTADGRERSLTLERQREYVVPDSVLDVLEHSHEAPYLRVLDRQSLEPRAQDLPPPPLADADRGKLATMVKTFGKKADATS